MENLLKNPLANFYRSRTKGKDLIKTIAEIFHSKSIVYYFPPVLADRYKLRNITTLWRLL